MNKNVKIALYIGGGLLFVAIVVFIVKMVKAKKAANAAPTDTNTQGANAATVVQQHTGTAISYVSTKTPAYESLPDGDFPLKQGSKNKLTWIWQLYLTTVKGKSITVDGSWGAETQAASVEALPVGATQLTKAIAKQLMSAVPSSKAGVFVEYKDLINAKINS